MAYKNAPGVLRMKCMIWEPDPIRERTQQEYGVVYNSTTLKTLPERIQKTLRTLDRAPYGIFLREKYVYRDTFLKIGDEHLQTQRLNFKAENGDDLFTVSNNTAIPNYPYIQHQTFNLIGSLYSTKIATPTALKQDPEVSKDASLTRWEYQERFVPFQHDGHDSNDNSNLHDYVESINMLTSDQGFEENVSLSSNISVEEAEYLKYRKVHRFMPMQIAATSEQKGRAGNDNDPSKPLHWLVEKETELYSGEDFFVEFIRLAQPDVVPSSQGMLKDYNYLDSTYNTQNTNGIVENAGVVEIDDSNSVVKNSINTFNLSNQPYYLIELGRGDSDHHYFIVLAYNSNPIFLQVGKFGVLVKNAKDPSIEPKIITPTNDVSRKLSTYEDVSCRELMGQESLRITVRMHLGNIVVTFSGHEGKPWVISRTDYINAKPANQTNTKEQQDQEENQSCGVPLTNMDEKPVAMNIAGKKIRIGAGNIKSGFCFGPLHYEEFVTFLNPNAITVKGPVSKKDINIYLGERNKFFFQDAEIFIETKEGISCIPGSITRKNTANSKWPIKRIGKNTTSADYCKYIVLNKDGEAISYIAAEMATNLGSSPNSVTDNGEESTNEDANKCDDNQDNGGDSDDTQNQKIPGAGTYIKWFNMRFTLGAGDAKVGGSPTTNNANNNSPNAPKPPKEWFLWNCITPVATGWRLMIDPNKIGHRQTPVDVARHVENFNHSWSYSDNVKIDHTGSIRFRVNLGTATSISGDNTVPVGTEHDTENVDSATYLLSLTDKTFFVRVYAWWEGGYMDCHNSECPCRKPGGANGGPNDNAKHCIFTGLCHGGEVTIEGNTRFIDCQLLDYMKIMQDQYFLNSPFFDGMSDYYAVKLISDLAGFAATKQGNDVYPPGYMIDYMANHAPVNGDTKVVNYINSGEPLMLMAYTLPSSYDILQNPFMKFSDGSKYDEALTKIGTLAGKVAFFDRFGVLRYDVRPDSLFLSNAGKQVRRPKCNFMASPHALGNCNYLDLLALNQYTYKRAVSDVVNDILLVTATPQGEVLVKSVLNLPGRYSPQKAGYIGYTKRLLQMEGIFGSQKALETIANYYANIVFKPPTVVTWESMGVPHLQAMDIVTFTGLNDDKGFSPHNVDSGVNVPKPTMTLVLTSVSGEINPERGEWRNKYEGEWLYGNIAD